MKATLAAGWKWILVACIVAAVGVLMVLGGRKRGTRLYRWRMSLWSLSLAILGGGLIISSCDTGGGSDKETVEEERGLCYAADFVGDPDLKDTKAEEPFGTCYAAPEDYFSDPDVKDGKLNPDITVTCYEPVLDVQPQPDQGPMCYDPALDVKPETEPEAVWLDDMAPTCYLIALDAVPTPDSGSPDTGPVPTCYDSLPPDVKPEAAQEDVVEQPDVPGPTCYAPPAPDAQ